MGDETSKSISRRLRDPAYAWRYFVGHGIDIGAGSDCLINHQRCFPNLLSCRDWDLADGDAQYMASVKDNTYDFVHSSHCLEHLYDPAIALSNWLRIVKPGGHIVVIIPDEDMYEQGRWPASFNSDHKVSFTTWKPESWCPKSINVCDLVRLPGAEVLKIESLHMTYDWDAPTRRDQTGGAAEAAIEFIIRKRTSQEIEARGRFAGMT